MDATQEPESPRPLTADLLDALRKPGESYEDLAGRLPISLSTVNRWKRESTKSFDDLMGMLRDAGWLNARVVARLQAAEEAARDFQRQVGELRSPPEAGEESG